MPDEAPVINTVFVIAFSSVGGALAAAVMST
jgi:hypothetical protein